MTKLTTAYAFGAAMTACTMAVGLLSLGPMPAWAAEAEAEAEAKNQAGVEVVAMSEDGLPVYGEYYSGGMNEDYPLILQFHQGGSNGRGEYGPLALWINGGGFRTIAWDQRAGGDLYGGINRTASEVTTQKAGYCDAYADLEAALDYAIEETGAEKVIVWGSSYSGSLAFRLAAEHPEHVQGVIAFSPASGGPVAECRAGLWADKIKAPALVLRPESEMSLESARDQRKVLEAAGVEFRVIENGTHGSSMLVDERTGADMSKARAMVLSWLRWAESQAR